MLIYTVTQTAALFNSSNHPEFEHIDELNMKYQTDIEGTRPQGALATVSNGGSDGIKGALCPIGVYCLKPGDPSHDVKKCVGMTFQLRIFPKKFEIVKGRKEIDTVIEVQLPGPTMMAWMNYSIIFIGQPNTSQEWTEFKKVDGKKIKFLMTFHDEIPADSMFPFKIEVWGKASSEQKENSVAMFERLELDYLSDLTIQCKDRSIEVHKVLLAKTSEFFKGEDFFRNIKPSARKSS